MIRLFRVVGVVLIGVGIIVIATWLIEPLRSIVPMIINWFQTLPIAMQVGLVIAAAGFVLLFSSIVWERLEDRKSETDLLED